MFEIDREKFGRFVAERRKEKGYTQKELASRLFVSDKAVSKWERGLSMPDIALLTPLAELLGVTVTELLECRRIESAMETEQVEALLQRTLRLSARERPRRAGITGRRVLIYGACLLLAALELLALSLLGWTADALKADLGALMGICAAFGFYFWFLVPERLPDYYDGNRIGTYSDGPIRMNLPGVSFHNRNWPHIVKAGRWAMLSLLAGYPALYGLLSWALGSLWEAASPWVMLAAVLGGLFVPLYAAAKRQK